MTKSQRRKVASSHVTMGDARHPKPYPRGPKHPKLGVSETWKRRVDHALEQNRKANRAPRGRAELARMIKADKGGLTRMLDSHQDTYKYAKQVSEVLGIPYAKVDNPELTDGVTADEWDTIVATIKKLPEDEQRRLLRVFQAAAKTDD